MKWKVELVRERLEGVFANSYQIHALPHLNGMTSNLPMHLIPFWSRAIKLGRFLATKGTEITKKSPQTEHDVKNRQ